MNLMILKRLIISLLLIVSLLAGTTTLASQNNPGAGDRADQQPGTQLRSNGTVRLRAEPRNGGAVLGQIAWGDIVTLLAVHESGRWYQVDFNGVIGWVASEWFVPVDGASMPQQPPQIPVEPPDTSAPPTNNNSSSAPASVSTGTVQANDTVRIRRNPSLESAVLGQMAWGETAALLGTDRTGLWYQVDFNGIVGWVWAQWLSVVSGDAPPVTAPSNNVAPVQPTAQTAVESAPPVLSNTTGAGMVQSQGTVRIRQSPSTTAAIIGMIGWGETAILLGVDASGIWYQIDYNGLVGWTQSEWYTLVSGEITAPITNAPDAIPATAIVPTTVSAPTVNTVPGGSAVQAQGTVRIRNRANLSSGYIGQIGWGQTAALIGTDRTGLWYQIDFNGKVGWVRSEWFVLVDGSVPPPPPPVHEEEATAPEPEQNLEVAVSVPIPVEPDGSLLQARDNIRIRGAIGANAPVVGQIGWGQTASLIATDGAWYQVNYNGITGWALGELFIRIAGDTSGGTTAFVPIPEPIEEPAPTAGANISIPKIGVQLPIIEFPIIIDPTEGAIWYIDPNERYVGHLEGTARPGEAGNIVLGAHSEFPNGAGGPFGSLAQLAVGDTITVSVGGVAQQYTVTRTFVVPFTDVSVVMPTGRNQVTLMTCTSYSPSQGIYLERLIVVAER